MYQGGPGGYLVGVRGDKPQGKIAHGPADIDYADETGETGMRTIRGEDIDPRLLVFKPLPTPPPAREIGEPPHSEEEKEAARDRLKEIEQEIARGGKMDKDEFNELVSIIQSKPEPIGPEYRYDDEANEWVLVKQYGQEPSFETRQVEEAPPKTDDSLDVGTGVGMGENDQCCEEAKVHLTNIMSDYFGSVPLKQAAEIGMINPIFARLTELDCNEFREALEHFYPNINEPERVWAEESYFAYETLKEWDACVGQQFSGDTFTAGHGSAGVLVSKHAESPEAKRHKYQYDKKYMSTPERIKYREDLNRERRKRGIYGRGGPDMSHTKRGTLVAEDPHANRARHFKERGTLKSVGVKKANGVL